MTVSKSLKSLQSPAGLQSCESVRTLLCRAVATSALLCAVTVPTGAAFAESAAEKPGKSAPGSSSSDAATPSASQRVYAFDIPAQPLMQALDLLSQQADVPYSVQSGTNIAVGGRAVQGAFTLSDALRQMLAGTDISFVISGNTVIVLPQQNTVGQDGSIVTTPVTVTANRVPTITLGAGAESGLTVLNEEQIHARVQGDNDPGKIFRANPNVQFQSSFDNPNYQDRLEERGDTAVAEQDLRPAGISISGGKIDQNNIMLDGVSINTYAGVENQGNNLSNMPDDDDNLINADSVYGAHPQSVYIDANILEQAEIIDSNVSAKHGGFQGGVVNYKVKNPGKEPEFSANIARSGSNWTDYHVRSRDAPDADARPPKYERLRYGASASTPLNENWGMLVSAGRRTAETTRSANADYYLMDDVTTKTVADNVLGKLRYENEAGLGLTVQMVYTPYAQEWESTRRYDSAMDILGNGLNGYVGLDTPLDWDGFGFSHFTFESKLSLNSSKVGRDAETNIARQVRSTAGGTYSGICNSTNCNIGTLGDLYQSQQEVSYQADFTAQHGQNDVAFGADIRRLHAEAERPETAYYARSPSANAAITCLVANDPFCENGAQASRFMTEYGAYNGDVSFYTGALYGQYGLNFDDVPFGALKLQPGLRLERDTFLGNTNLAPRFNTTYETDFGIDFNVGWNRYYASNLLSYALRDLSPGTVNYGRTIASSGGSAYQVGAFSKRSSSRTNYGGSGLKTPYTDEKTASISFPLPVLGGETRLKMIERKGHDQFSREASERGSTSYTLSNEGSSRYTSYSVEWVKEFDEPFLGGRHSFNINGQYGERSVSNNSYFGSSEEDEDIVYNGQLVSPDALSLITGNLDEPWLINIALYSQFDDDRLRTGLTGRYTFPYTIIADSGSNQRIGGTSYDVYEERQEKARFDLDLTLDYDLISAGKNVLTMNVSVVNVLNRAGSHTLVSSSPYRKGRTVWLGLTYSY